MREPFFAALSWSDASILSTNSISPVISRNSQPISTRSKLNGDKRCERYGGNGSAGGHARPDSAIRPQVPQAEDEVAGGADTGDDPVLSVRSGLHHAPLQRFEVREHDPRVPPGGSLLQLRRRHERLQVVQFPSTTPSLPPINSTTFAGKQRRTDHLQQPSSTCYFAAHAGEGRPPEEEQGKGAVVAAFTLQSRHRAIASAATSEERKQGKELLPSRLSNAEHGRERRSRLGFAEPPAPSPATTKAQCRWRGETHRQSSPSPSPPLLLCFVRHRRDEWRKERWPELAAGKQGMRMPLPSSAAVATMAARSSPEEEEVHSLWSREKR
nr:hypothetical protein Iba_chr05aCG10120 [Ipomoea batatas]